MTYAPTSSRKVLKSQNKEIRWTKNSKYIGTKKTILRYVSFEKEKYVKIGADASYSMGAYVAMIM